MNYNRYRVNFKYKDKFTNHKWNDQSCIVYAEDENGAKEKCINIYGLTERGVKYEIISVEEA